MSQRHSAPCRLQYAGTALMLSTLGVPWFFRPRPRERSRSKEKNTKGRKAFRQNATHAVVHGENLRLASLFQGHNACFGTHAVHWPLFETLSLPLLPYRAPYPFVAKQVVALSDLLPRSGGADDPALSFVERGLVLSHSRRGLPGRRRRRLAAATLLLTIVEH